MKRETVTYFLVIILIVYLLHTNNVLKQKVNACSWNIGVMNSSIKNANIQLENAHKKAWLDYQTMGYALEDLESGYSEQTNPCDPGYTGDLSSFPHL